MRRSTRFGRSCDGGTCTRSRSALCESAQTSPMCILKSRRQASRASEDTRQVSLLGASRSVGRGPPLRLRPGQGREQVDLQSVSAGGERGLLRRLRRRPGVAGLGFRPMGVSGVQSAAVSVPSAFFRRLVPADQAAGECSRARTRWRSSIPARRRPPTAARNGCGSKSRACPFRAGAVFDLLRRSPGC